MEENVFSFKNIPTTLKTDMALEEDVGWERTPLIVHRKNNILIFDEELFVDVPLFYVGLRLFNDYDFICNLRPFGYPEGAVAGYEKLLFIFRRLLYPDRGVPLYVRYLGVDDKNDGFYGYQMRIQIVEDGIPIFASLEPSDQTSCDCFGTMISYLQALRLIKRRKEV